MDIKRMILTDGRIVSYQSGPDSLIVRFVDYCDHSYELMFMGGVEFVDNDGVGYDISNSKIINNGDRHLLELFDDDSNSMFRVTYTRAVVTEVD